MVRRRILIPLFVVLLALAVGTLGYVLIEGWRRLRRAFNALFTPDL